MKRILMICIMIVVISACYSLTIRLKSGNVITGTMSAKQNSSYIITTMDGKIQIPISSVISITDKEVDLTKTYIDLPDFAENVDLNNQVTDKPKPKEISNPNIMIGVLGIVFGLTIITLTVLAL